jgi:NAD+ synthase
MHMRVEEIAEWLRGRVSAAGAQGLVVGLSGGIDSAVVLGLCRQAMPERTIGMILPCGSDPRDEEDARLTANHFQVPVLRIDLAPVYVRLTTDLTGALSQQAAAAATAGTPSADPGDAASFTAGSGSSVPGEPRPEPSAPRDTGPGSSDPGRSGSDDGRAHLPQANLKPRLRMACLYYAANTLNYLVAGTGNRSELTIGYYTKYGDGGVDLLPIGHLLKSDVRALAADLGVPQPIIDKPPSAGLWPGQTDEDDMGFSYAQLERYLEEGPQGVPPATALRIERLVRRTDHKRALPPTPGDA